MLTTAEPVLSTTETVDGLYMFPKPIFTMPGEDYHAYFDYCNACSDPVNVQLLGFEYSIAC